MVAEEVVTEVGKATKWENLVKRSTTTLITVLSEEHGRQLDWILRAEFSGSRYWKTGNMGLARAVAVASIDSVCLCSALNIAKPLRRHCPTSASPLFFCFRKKCNLKLQKSIRDAAEWKISCSLLKVEDGINDEACELVNGVELSLGEGDTDDNIRAYLFKAVKNNNGTGILLLSDVYGFEDSFTRDFAYRVACNGYNILVPDLFRGDPWTKEQPKTVWIDRQNLERIRKDITIWTKWLVDEFMGVGNSKKLGIIGFDFGGGGVLEVLAQDQGACFGTGISFYGTRMDPLAVAASDIKAPVLFILGEDDPLCNVREIENIQKKIGRGSKVVIFPGRGHGFAHRPGSPEEDEDAEQAYVIMRNWLYHNLVL